MFRLAVMRPRLSTVPRRRDARGFSLAEMLVASAVFLLVVLAAYQAFNRSNQAYQGGQNQAEMVQGARVAFDSMVTDIREAGFEFDVDGPLTRYPNQPDEPLEYMHRRAIVVRGNYDFDKELRGREAGLEKPGGVDCCPVVTTANDEIVGYALGKPQGTTQPTGTITMHFDTSGTSDANDTNYRDAYVVKTGSNVGSVLNEETVTVSGFDLGALTDPPYVLYRFTFNEDGTVNKQPLIDNVQYLEFTYYDEADNIVVGTAPNGTVTDGTATIWGNDNSSNSNPQDGDLGRATRWSVRRVSVTVQTMTPERDLGLLRANTAPGADVANVGGKRLFKLQEDIVPPNLGRRGQTDRDINPPEPVRNVTLCTGQCRFVRVSWEPGPPEDRVADDVVILCSDANCANVICSAVVPANYDPIPDPDQEYYSLTNDECPGLTTGVNVWARVIARNQAGTESECPVQDCPECCKSLTSAMIKSETRLDAFNTGSGTGYAAANTAWPNARPDNVGGVPVMTTATDPAYPQANQITVTLAPPQFVLNRVSGAGPAPYNWTTKPLSAGGAASMTCHEAESTPIDPSDNPAYRTPFENAGRDESYANFYVFRVAGHDNWNWSSGGNALQVTDPRNFVPGPDNLYDYVHVDLRADSISYTDTALYNFGVVAGEVDQYDERFDSTGQNAIAPPLVGPTNRPVTMPPRALVPGEVYYYKFRTVDQCWFDKQPAPIPDGINDDDAGLGSDQRKAWSISRDFSNNNTWRQKALSLSPFYPPLIPQADSTGNRDKPSTGTNDSDDYPSGNNPLNAWAIPGYALPPKTADGSAYVKPEKPTEFYMSKVDDAGTNLLSAGAGNKDDARLVFNAARRTAPTDPGVAPVPATFNTYRLYRKRATSLHPSGSEMAFNISSGTRYIEFQTKGQQAVYAYTLDTSSKGAPTAAGASGVALLQDIGTLIYPGDCSGGGQNDGTSCYPWIYRLVTTQCSDTILNDAIDTSSGEESAPSRPFLYPCQFYDQIRTVVVAPQTATHPSSVGVTVTMKDGAGLPDPGCDGDPSNPNDTQLKAARLLAYRTSGDYLGTSDWYTTTDAQCTYTFNQAAIDKALREYAGSARFVVELSDTADNGAASDTNSAGCRVRSDLLGAGADLGTTMISCTAVCGNNGGQANIFQGGTSPTPMTSTLATTSVANDTIRVTIPKAGACGDFTIFQLEFGLTNATGPIPTFQGAKITGGVAGTLPITLPNLMAQTLPDNDFKDIGATESDLSGGDGSMMLRWYQSFKDPLGGPPSYPRSTGSGDLVVELQFAANACNVTVSSFNFRVAANLDGDPNAEELLCTTRAAGNDPQQPQAVADATHPEGQFNTGSGGTGRSLTSPAGVCASCTTQSPVAGGSCYCPVNQNDTDGPMDLNPTVALADDNDNGPQTRVMVHFSQTAWNGTIGSTASGCDYAIQNIELDMTCQGGRLCNDPSNGIPIGKINDAYIIHNNGVGPRVALVGANSAGYPNLLVTESDTEIHYKWQNLSGITIANNEIFDLDFGFTIEMADTQVVTITVDWGTPLNTCSGGFTSCPKPGSAIPVP